MLRAFFGRPLGSKVILLGSLALLILTLAPWQRPCAVTTNDKICGFVTAWNGFGVWVGVLAAAIFVWESLPIALPRLSMRGWPTATITAIASVALAVVTTAKLITDNEFQTGWAWVGLGLALAIALTALIRVRFRWETRGKDGVTEPTPPTTPPADPPSS